MLGLIALAFGAAEGKMKSQQHTNSRLCCLAEWQRDLPGENPVFHPTDQGMSVVPHGVVIILKALQGGIPLQENARVLVEEAIAQGRVRFSRWEKKYFFGELTENEVVAYLKGA